MVASALQVTMSSLSPSSPSPAIRRRGLCYALNSKGAAKIPIPPINPKDPFLSKLASVAATSPETLLDRPVSSDMPPYLDLFESPKLMATPAQVCVFLHISSSGPLSQRLRVYIDEIIRSFSFQFVAFGTVRGKPIFVNQELITN